MKTKNIISIGFLLLVFCLPVRKELYFYHLIIDAGSSGTRFCTYKIRFQQFQCKLHDKNSPCFSIPSRNGLAELNSKEIREVLHLGIQKSFSRYKNIRYIALLGTGGFRKITEEQREKKLRTISEFFLHIPVASKVKFISGKEESFFAWKSIRVLFNSSSHITLETGGATIQIAIGDKNFQYISLPLGMNQSYQKLIAYKKFKKCKYGNILNSFEYEQCKNILKEKIFNQKELQFFLKKNQALLKQYKTYTLGKPWKAIFHYSGNPDQLSIKRIEKKGKEFCALSRKELIQKGVPSQFAKKTCYLFIYHSAQLESLQLKKVYRGTESWTIGAATSRYAIPYCK